MARPAMLVTNGLLIGTPASPHDAVNCRDCSADPSVLQDAIGVTWDCLDICLAYGLTGKQAKALLTATPLSQLIRQRDGERPVSGSHSGSEDGVRRTGGGDSGIMAEVGDRLVMQDGAEHAVDHGMHGAIPRLLHFVRRALGRMKPQRLALEAVQQPAEPRPLSALLGKFSQDGDGHQLERGGSSGGVGFVGKGHRFGLVKLSDLKRAS